MMIGKTNKGITMHAFEDYWGTPEGLGPYVENFRILQVNEAASRRVMLETGEAQIAEVPLSYFPELIQSGFSIHKGAGFNSIHNISFAGNYWDKYSVLTGAPLSRDRDISMPWVGDPFENGEYSETTASMISSMKVRNALA